MALEKENEKTLRYVEWYTKKAFENVSFDRGKGVINIVKDRFEAYKGEAVDMEVFRQELNMLIKGVTDMKCIYHLDVEEPHKRNRRESMINEKIKMIYENDVEDEIVCGDKDPNDPAFYDEAKYIVSVKMKRILIEIEDKLYIIPLEVKYIDAREL